MNLFNFNEYETLTFCAVFIRYSVLFSVLPFLGDRMVPMPLKALFSFTMALILFPTLVSSGDVHSMDSKTWGNSTVWIVRTFAAEAFFGLLFGFTARFTFEGISFGANLMGNFMGFASASIFDPHQESHTEVIAHLQMTLAMLLFLGIDGHHDLLKAALQSYHIVGLGLAQIDGIVSQKLIQMSSHVIQFGFQVASPIAISLFIVNLSFGLMAKNMPHLNIFSVSTGISALIGFITLMTNHADFNALIENSFEKMNDQIFLMMSSVIGTALKKGN